MGSEEIPYYFDMMHVRPSIEGRSAITSHTVALRTDNNIFMYSYDHQLIHIMEISFLGRLKYGCLQSYIMKLAKIVVESRL